jgi:hypothetical protein
MPWYEEEREPEEPTGTPQAMRYNQGKLQWSLMDMKSFEPMIRVLEFGAKKYARDNWKKGMFLSAIYDSLTRHMISFMAGEDNDPESGLPHIGHIQCNIMFMSYVLQHHPQLDDRPDRAPTPSNSVPVNGSTIINTPLTEEEFRKGAEKLGIRFKPNPEG